MSAAYGDEACSCLRCSPSRLLVIFHTLRPTTKLNLGRASPDLDFGATFDRLNKQVVGLEGAASSTHAAAAHGEGPCSLNRSSGGENGLRAKQGMGSGGCWM
ncbi:hypothetical protein PVAP13_1NG334500 [Panicum virgatum]|uniref:Uncharacterized protein n=1 Tax=Panicum virgatum TaxID=38727 RepID=A0A8T0X0D3_PANVG|nr:hypothetical protein PVAP13_1NG334500 [Panicum virgatum]